VDDYADDRTARDGIAVAWQGRNGVPAPRKGKESSVRPVAPGKKVRNRRKTVEKHTKQDENRRNLALFQPLRRHSAGAIKSEVAYPYCQHLGPLATKGQQRRKR